MTRMKVFMKTGVYLILAIILQICSFMILLIKKLIGKMKDEFRGNIIHVFVGLKSKMYYLVMVDDKEIKKAKSVNENIVDSIRHKEYVDVLFSRGLIRHNMKRIQNKLHRTGTSVFVKFLCHVFMINAIFLMMMVLVVYFIFIGIH